MRQSRKLLSGVTWIESSNLSLSAIFNQGACVFQLSFLLLSVITFFSAFLLFQIELIIAKLLLPIYGGSYLVWGACVVFFQAVLLAGYAFAHKGIDMFGFKKYLKIHLVLLLIPFFFFPGRSIHVDHHASGMPLVLDIFVRLITTIGPVFLVLSTISLVTQAWLSSSDHARRNHPFILYAISNVGSFLALWSYPFFVEPLLTNTEQLNIWRVIYVLLVALTIWAFRVITVKDVKTEDEGAAVVTRSQALRWLLLSAAGVMLFLSVTNLITYEVAPIPLLWIIPLSIYLLSFILCFKSKPWYPSWFKFIPAIAITLGVTFYFQVRTSFLPAAWSVILFNLILFFLCLFTQKELIQSKPSSGKLTFFYVMISLGGFLGGFVTSWIVPLISYSPVEFLFGLGIIAFVYPHKITRLILLALIMIAIGADYWTNPHHSLVKKRNYYGIYDVFDKNGVRTFVHGTTLHGIQWTDESKRFVPLGYYSPLSPLGEIFQKDIFKAQRVGAIGLGAGTTAMYSKPDVPMDFYELDPDVLSIAKSHFWYLASAPGHIRVAIGDARLSLVNTPGSVYDLLIVDAFGGDAIPVHLINKDVVKIYQEHLTQRGGILLHIPSRYFNLEPVLANIALETGAYVAIKEAEQNGITLRTFWAVMTWDQERFIHLISKEGWRELHTGDYKPMRTWTDDYSTVMPVMQWDQLWAALTHYKPFK